MMHNLCFLSLHSSLVGWGPEVWPGIGQPPLQREVGASQGPVTGKDVDVEGSSESCSCCLLDSENLLLPRLASLWV